MGFGTLLFGYFMLLDLPYQTLTNAVAASLMLFALYKLSYLNRGFRLASYSAMAFTVFALFEAVIEILSMFYIVKLENIAFAIVLNLLRNLFIGATTFLMLVGMRDVAYEVNLKRLSKKCDIFSKISFVIYAINLALLPDFSIIENQNVLYAVYFIYVCASIFTLFVIIMNLTLIYSCYNSICMPRDNTARAPVDTKSRFGFVNKFRAHEDEKRREYAEYRMNKKAAKGKGKNGK